MKTLLLSLLLLFAISCSENPFDPSKDELTKRMMKYDVFLSDLYPIVQKHLEPVGIMPTYKLDADLLLYNSEYMYVIANSFFTTNYNNGFYSLNYYSREFNMDSSITYKYKGEAVAYKNDYFLSITVYERKD